MVLWGGVGGDIFGGFNAAGYTVTHMLTTGAAVTADVAGTLDLGTIIANEIAIDNQPAAGTVTIGDSFTCYGFVQTSGALTMASKIITLGAGGLDYTDCSAFDHTGAFIFADDTAVANWSSGADYLGCIKVASGVTVSANGSIWTAAVGTTGADGALVLGAQALIIWPHADDFWAGDITFTATSGSVYVYAQDDWTNEAFIDVGTVAFRWGPSVTGKTLTLNNGLTCGALAINGNGGTVSGILTLAESSPLSCGAITLGSTGQTRPGILNLGSGSHTFTTLASVAGTTGNVVNFGTSKCTVGGNVTLAGIEANFGSAAIHGAAIVGPAASVLNTNADVFGRTAAAPMVVTDLDNTGNPILRVWNADVAGCTGNTNVQASPLSPDQLCEAA